MATISEAHAAAARANGAQSQGPITEEGKARSSQNATTHGLTGQTVVIDPCDIHEYNASVKEHFAYIIPIGPIETGLCSRMVDSTWQIRRAGILEVRLAAKAGEDPLISSDRFVYRQAISLNRHKNAHTRGYDKAWKELQALQIKRKQEEESRRTAPQEEARKEAEATLNAIRTQVLHEQMLHDLLGPDIEPKRKPKTTTSKIE